MFAVMAESQEIETIEGLARNARLHPIQQACIDVDAFHCGQGTPAQIKAAVGLICEEMSGNICRPGVCHGTVDAICTVDARAGVPQDYQHTEP